MKQVLQKIKEIRDELPPFEKDNVVNGVRFISDEQFNNALLPLLKAKNIVTIPHGTIVNDSFQLTMEIIDLDSMEKFEANMAFPVDAKDFSFGGTITLTVKYLWLKLLNVSGGDDETKKPVKILPPEPIKEVVKTPTLGDLLSSQKLEVPEESQDEDPTPVIQPNSKELEFKYQDMGDRIYDDPIIKSMPFHPMRLLEMVGKKKSNKAFRDLIITFLTEGEIGLRSFIAQKYKATIEDINAFAERTIPTVEFIPEVFTNNKAKVEIDIPGHPPREATHFVKIVEGINKVGIREMDMLDTIHLLQDTGKLDMKYRDGDKVHVPTFLMSATKDEILLVLNETKR